MTTPSGTELKDEQLDGMVAEVLGWRPCPCGKSRCWMPPSECENSGDLPRFSTSLDACATFEETLSTGELGNYAERLCRDYRGLSEAPLFGRDWYIPCLLATPRQRCIAFLRMKGVL